MKHEPKFTGPIEAAALVYARAPNAMIAYGMGLTQQVGGVENVQMVVNLLLLRGNIGTPGAGVLPVRGHSNVPTNGGHHRKARSGSVRPAARC